MHKRKRGALKSGSDKTVECRKQATLSACPKRAGRAKKCQGKSKSQHPLGSDAIHAGAGVVAQSACRAQLT